jgi:hypothetical protein
MNQQKPGFNEAAAICEQFSLRERLASTQSAVLAYTFSRKFPPMNPTNASNY